MNASFTCIYAPCQSCIYTCGLKLFIRRWHNKWADPNLASGDSFGPNLHRQVGLGFQALHAPLGNKWADPNLASRASSW